MKIIIINGENCNEKVEIDINEYSYVKDIKSTFDDVMNKDGDFTKNYFVLICKNMILFDVDFINYYKICPNDEIWFGKIENYLKNDDVIVEVFLAGLIQNEMWLIVKLDDSISRIRSIIGRIRPEIIDAWNTKGHKMGSDQTVAEINQSEYYKLIISCNNEQGEKINDTFDEYRSIHDQYWVDQYLCCYETLDISNDESKRNKFLEFINQLRQIISLNDTNNTRLNQDLSHLPSSFINSKNIFCNIMADCIWNISIDYWRSAMDEYENDLGRAFELYFLLAINAAMWDYVNSREFHTDNVIKSMRNIAIDALNYFVNFLIDAANERRYWLKLLMNQSLLTSLSDPEMDKIIDEIDICQLSVNVRMNEMKYEIFIPDKLKTIFQVKQAISCVTGMDINQLHCINPGEDDKPNDEESFDDEFIIEIVLS